MNEDRVKRGWEQVERVAGEKGIELTHILMDKAPELGKMALEFGFGDIYSRPALDLKQRELITIASLVTLGGCELQLRFHTVAALHCGLTPDELAETVLHCSAYAGFPRAMNAMFAMKEVFDQLGLEVNVPKELEQTIR